MCLFNILAGLHKWDKIFPGTTFAFDDGVHSKMQHVYAENRLGDSTEPILAEPGTGKMWFSDVKHNPHTHENILPVLKVQKDLS